MADTDNSAGAVFIELGLDLNKLESDFIAADETIQQNLGKLNREKNLIELRAQVELGNLDDAEKILEVKTRALNEQLKIQRDRIALTEAAYTQLVNSKGKTATATQNMEARLQREQLALQRLEGKLRDVAKAQENLNKSSSAGMQGESGKNPLLSMYNNFKGDVLSKIGDLSGEFGNLGKVASLADGAISGVIGAIGRIPTPVTAAVGAIAGLTVGIKAVEDALLSMAEPAITTGDTFWVASRGAQMTVKDFEELSTICKVTGIGLNEVTNALKRVDMQIVNGGTASKVLEKWGVEVRYANGELKNALDMSVAIADGLERAKAAGKGKDFIAGVFGKGASGDVVTYLEDLKGNVEAAKDIARNGLFDPERAHSVQGLINSMNTQSEQLESTFSSALMPIAEKIVPKITERIKELTKVIEDNADGIKAVGSAVASVAGVIADITAGIVKLGVSAVGVIGDVYRGGTDSLIKRYDGEWGKTIKSGKDLMQRELTQMLPTQRAAIEGNIATYNTTLAEYERKYRAVQERLQEISKTQEENENKVVNASEHTEEELAESTKRIEKYADELAKIKLDLKFGDNTFKKSLAELEQWHKESIAKAGTLWKERLKIEELYKARLEKLWQEPEKNVADLTKETANLEYARTHSAFEKQLHDIEQWKKAQLEKANTAKEVSAIVENAAQKEAKVFEDEMDRIRGKVQTLQEKIFEQEHSERANKAMQLQKERFELYNAGIYDPEDIERFYWNAAKKERLGKWANIDLYSQIQDQTAADMSRFGDNIPTPKQQNNITAPDFQKLSEEFQTKLATPLQLVSDTAKGLNISFGNVDGLFKSVGNSAMFLSNTLIDAANKISKLKFTPPSNTDVNKNQPQTKSLPQQQSNLKIQVPKNSDDNVANQLKNAAQKVSAKNTTEKFATKDFSAITKQLQDITGKLATIEQNSIKRNAQLPPITVSPNINVDLGGAYVFDNAMKIQLTDDITTDVANSVRDAVDLALNDFFKLNYGN